MDELLHKWNNSLGPDLDKKLALSLERRSFIGNSLKAAGGLALSPAIGLLSACSEDPQHLQERLQAQAPWSTFAVVQEILFPDDGNGPGALQINATAYLKFVLQAKDTDPDDREFILGGIDWLNDLALKDYKKSFLQCDSAPQNKLITKISQSNAGERWLSNLLLYIFEALLCDPAYGANPGGIGWQWLQHQPGFPSPPANKRYPDLL